MKMKKMMSVMVSTRIAKSKIANGIMVVIMMMIVRDARACPPP